MLIQDSGAVFTIRHSASTRFNNTTGASNTANGARALQTNTTGSGNTAI